jgi:hypothetical protein
MRDIASFAITCAECGFKARWTPNGLSSGILEDNPEDYALCRYFAPERDTLTPMTCRHFREALVKATVIASQRKGESDMKD